MLGNDDYSDCGEAAKYHLNMANSSYEGEGLEVYTETEVLTDYAAYLGCSLQELESDPEQYDTGTVLSQYLLFLFQAGLIDGFAPIDQTQGFTYLYSWAFAFKGLYCGVSLCDNSIPQFNAHQVWTLAGTQPDMSLGHAIPLLGWNTTNDEWVTWGQAQLSDHAWTTACLIQSQDGEAFIILTEELARAANFNYSGAVSELESLPQSEFKPTNPTPPSPVPPTTTVKAQLSAEMTRHNAAMSTLISQVKN
jgi:hypothetical protein